MTLSALALMVYFVLFAALHSLLADFRIKSQARQTLGQAADRWYRLTFTLLAVVMVLLSSHDREPSGVQRTGHNLLLSAKGAHVPAAAKMPGRSWAALNRFTVLLLSSNQPP